MKIIISPAKKMKEGVDFADAVSLPRYLDKDAAAARSSEGIEP